MASTTVYAAACNPPRNARQSTHTRSRARSPSESSSASEYTPEPVRPPVGPVEPVNSSPGAKRGRKPAVLSRTAREAQRKLNHSIIEKARRTKINEALATLKQLVPANYGQIPQIDDADLDDGEYDGASKKKKAGGSARRRSSNWKSWNGRSASCRTSLRGSASLNATVSTRGRRVPAAASASGQSTKKMKSVAQRNVTRKHCRRFLRGSRRRRTRRTFLRHRCPAAFPHSTPQRSSLPRSVSGPQHRA